MRYLGFVILILLAASFVSSGQETFFSASNDRPNSKIIYTSIETGGTVTKLKGYFIPKTMVVSSFNPDEYILAGEDTLKSISKLTYLDRDTSAAIKSFYFFDSDTVHFIKYFQPLLHPVSNLFISDDTLLIHFPNQLDPVKSGSDFNLQIDTLFQSYNLVGACRLIKSAKLLNEDYSYSREDWVKWIFPFSLEYINIGEGVDDESRNYRLQYGKTVLELAKEDNPKNESYVSSLEDLMLLGDSILFFRCINDMGEQYGTLIDKAVAKYKEFGWESIYGSRLLDIFVDNYINKGDISQLIEFANVKETSYAKELYSGVFDRCPILDYFLETKNYRTIIDLTERYINDIVDCKEDIPQNIAYYYFVSSILLGRFAEVEKITEKLIDKYENNLIKPTLSNLFNWTDAQSDLMYINANANCHLGDFEKSENMLRKIESLWANDIIGIPLKRKTRISQLYQAVGVDSAAYRLAISVAEDCNSWLYKQLSDTLFCGMLRHDNNIFGLRHNNFDEYINLPLEIGMKSQDPVLLRLVYNNNCVNKKLIPEIENNFLKYFFINDSIFTKERENIDRILNRINALDRAGIKSTSEIVSLQRELREAKSRVFRRFTRENPKPIIIPDFFNETISNLKHNAIAVEFLSKSELNHDQTEYIALILKHNDSIPQAIRLCNEYDLQELSYNDSKYLERIYDLIWSPLKPFIEDRDTLYFSTSGTLNQLPIENALYNRNPISLFRLTSTHNLVEHEQSVKDRLCYAIYGDLDYENYNDEIVQIEHQNFPSSLLGGKNIRGRKGKLKWARAEIDSIALSLSKTNNIYHVFDKNKGTERSVYLLNCDSINVLHFATHGFFYSSENLYDEEKKELPFVLFDNDGQPSYVENKSMTRSGLLLSGANITLSGNLIKDYDPTSDGILTAQEISTLSFPNLNHVVLSACETGLGENCSEGVYGLQRGFKNAGAKSILI